MYGRLLDSFVVWYRSRGLGRYTYMMSATAISAGMLLNVMFLTNLVSLLGPYNLAKHPLAAKLVFPLSGVLWVANALLLRARYGGLAADPQGRPPNESHRPALTYLLGSLVLMLASFWLLLVLKP